MADFAVSTKFTALDRVTKALSRMGKGATQFGDRTDRAFRKASRSGSRFGDILKGVLSANLITGGFRLLARGLREVTGQFVSLDDAIFSAAAKFKDVNLRTTEGRKRFEALRVAARDVGGATEFTATQAAKGLDELAKVGFTSSQAMSSLLQVANLASVAQTDLAEATAFSTKTLGAFGLRTKDTVQLQKNFVRVNDVMAAVMTSSASSIEEMFDAVRKGGPIFRGAGQTLETFGALTGIMADNSDTASEAGTKLRNFMLVLAEKGGKAQKELANLGITVADSAGNFRDIVDIFGDLEKATTGFGNVRLTALLDQIFGRRGIGGAQILLGAGAKTIREFRDELLAAGGASTEMAEFMRMSLGGVIKQLQSAALEKAFKVLDIFRERGRNILGGLLGGIRAIDVAPIVNVLEDLSVVIGNIKIALTPVVQTLGPLFIKTLTLTSQALAFLSPVLTEILIAFGVYKTLMFAVAVAQGAVLVTSPFGLILLGISLVVGGIIFLLRHLDQVKAAWRITWTFIKESFAKSVNEIVDKFFLLVKIPLLIARMTAQAFGRNTDFLDSLIGRIDLVRDRLSLAVPTQNISDFLNLRGVQTTPRGLIVAGQRGEQNVNVRVELAGAPAGSTAVIDSDSPGTIDVSLIGINP